MSNDPGIRLGCLELAAQLNKPAGIYDATEIVKTATVLYTFTQAPSAQETEPTIVDKPRKRGKPVVDHPDILA